MKRSVPLLFCLILSIADIAAPVEIFVDPTGDDANPGTQSQPVASPTGARNALRAWRAAHNGLLPEGGAVLTFADGTYTFATPLELDARDAGTAETPIRWRAATRTRALFTGACLLSSGHAVTDAAVRDLLPAVARDKALQYDLPDNLELPSFLGGFCIGKRKISQPLSLFQGTRRLPSACWPNAGYTRVSTITPPFQKRHDAVISLTGIFGYESDRLSAWAHEPELWADGLWVYEWADAKVPVQKIDPIAKQISVPAQHLGGYGIRDGAAFRVFNALSELDRPGEWVLDRAHHRLYVWPLDNAEPLALASAPGLIRGTARSHGSCEGCARSQARTDAISFSSCTNCTIRATIVRDTSAWGIIISGGRDCRVEGCDLFELGEGGIALEGGIFETLTPANHIADNNHIHHYGRVTANYRPGVRLTGVGNHCTHNLIHHALHQAIGFQGNDHRIVFNITHDTCMQDDAGTIYCCQRDWTKRGTVIEHNLLHMTGKQPRTTHTKGIYLDDFSSGVIVRHNLINRASPGIYIGGGNDNLVYGNVTMNCDHGITLGSRGVESFGKMWSGAGRKSMLFKPILARPQLFGNTLWTSRYPKLLAPTLLADPIFAHNALYNQISNNVAVGCGGTLLENWRKIAADTVYTNNLETAEDPGFEDYFNFGWELRPGPARDLVGRLRVAEMGLYASDNRVSPPVKLGDNVTRPRPLRVEYAPARVSLHLLAHKKPAPNDPPIATALKHCIIPSWSRGERITSMIYEAEESWKDYSLSFVPSQDGTFALQFRGARGEKTAYDNIRVNGATLAGNASFENLKGWRQPTLSPQDNRLKISSVTPPYGIADAASVKLTAVDGTRVAICNDVLNVTGSLNVKA
ncbi:MAG: right-handed parallel beta-helix repeat-containing protein, partial [Kiritimatiellae bacterium]|nr:right-handed parallel beta-helix repeat-containing protein [Kiritimatiellia bacterium]